MKLLAIFLLILSSAFSFSLKETEIDKIYHIIETLKIPKPKDKSARPAIEDNRFFKKIERFTGANNKIITYAKFGGRTGINGSLVFINGLNENLLKYTETYYDFYLAGWSPVYVLDHRGQGFSEKLTKDSAVNHIDSFENYTADLDFFIDQIVLKDEQVNKSKIFALSHSMGGAILIDYLQTYSKKNPFHAVAISAPLIRIRAHIPYFLYEEIIFPIFKARCLSRCDNKAINPFQIKSLSFLSSLTTSRARYNFAKDINKKHGLLALSGPSYRWVLEISKLHKLFTQKDRVKKIKPKILILQAEKDTIVSNIYQNRFCSMMPKTCTLKNLDARHEILLERDEIRDVALTEIMKSFKSPTY